MSRKFKKAKNKNDFISDIRNEVAKWIKEHLSFTDLLLIISSFPFSINVWIFLIRLLFAFGIVFIKEDDDNPYFPIISYNLVSFIIFIIKIPFSGILYITQYPLIFFLLFIIIYAILLALGELWFLYFKLLKLIARANLKSKFPITKDELIDCGVYDRLECLLYYHYMLHGFGLFKNKIMDSYDYPIQENLYNLISVFYSFDLSDESNKIIKEAIEKKLISEDIARFIYSQPYGPRYRNCSYFEDLLGYSNKLYLSLMKK